MGSYKLLQNRDLVFSFLQSLRGLLFLLCCLTFLAGKNPIGFSSMAEAEEQSPSTTFVSEPSSADPNTAEQKSLSSEDLQRSAEEEEMILGSAQRRIDLWEKQLEGISSALHRFEKNPSQNPLNLVYLQAALRTLSKTLKDFIDELTPESKKLQNQLTILASEKDLSPFETESLRLHRLQLQEKLGAVQSAAKQGEALQQWTQDLLEALTDHRRAGLQRTLFKHEDSPLNLQLWQATFTEGPAILDILQAPAIFFESTGASLSGFPSFPERETAHYISPLLLLLGSLTLCITLLLGIIPLFFAFIDKKIFPQLIGPVPFPNLQHQTRRALFRVGSALALSYLFFSAGLSVLEHFTFLSQSFLQIGQTLLKASVFFVFVVHLCSVLLAPCDSQWRLAPLHTRAARFLWIISILLGALYSTAWITADVLRTLFEMGILSSTPLLLLKGVWAVLMGGGAVLGVMFTFFLSSFFKEEEIETPEESSSLPPLLTLLLFVVGLAGVMSSIASLLGYVSFGFFIAQQIVWTCAMVGGGVLLLRFLNASLGGPISTIAPPPLHPSSPLPFKPFKKSLQGQIGALVSGILSLSVLLLITGLILRPWGIEPVDVVDLGVRVLRQIGIENVNVSLANLIIGGALLALGIILTRRFQHWLDTKYLPTTRLDIGVRSSLRTACGYLGMTIAVVVALSYLGLNLQNIALVAGALSVGIGFGLQSVVNNFVSGLILLIERPIKIGDWVVVGQDEGYVRRINVRSTEIETFERCSVIVPNSLLISERVKNWMHRNKVGRIQIPIRVAYDSDPEQVRALLISCAKTHSALLSIPEPCAYLMDFGESSLKFELRAYLSDIENSLSVRSDLRFEILKQLRLAGIQIPFPQRDLHIKSPEASELFCTKSVPVHTQT